MTPEEKLYTLIQRAVKPPPEGGRFYGALDKDATRYYTRADTSQTAGETGS